MSMPIRNLKRVATPTIRGFTCQLLVAANQLLDLDPEATLVVEGNEDIDRAVVRNGLLVEASEESIKDLENAISARSEAAYETIANFLRAFAHYEKRGVPCSLIFTTTAARAAQSVDDRLVPKLDSDLLADWALSNSGGNTRTDQAIFADIVKLMDVHYADDKGIATAIELVKTRGVEQKFLRSVHWNFKAKPVDALQNEVFAKLHLLEDGDKAKASAVADRLIAALWTAAATKQLEARTFTRKTLDEIRGAVHARFISSRNWDQMQAFTSWSNWAADHYNVALWREGNDVAHSACLAVSYKPISAERNLASVLRHAMFDPVIGSEARALISEGKFDDAAWCDQVLLVRFLDAVRSEDLSFYVCLSNGKSDKTTVRKAIEARRVRADRVVVDCAADSATQTVAPRLTVTADRGAHLCAARLLARAMCEWHARKGEDSARILRWFYPLTKLFIDPAGNRHEQRSAWWEQVEPLRGAPTV